MTFDSYAEVPKNVADEIIAKVRAPDARTPGARSGCAQPQQAPGPVAPARADRDPLQ